MRCLALLFASIAPVAVARAEVIDIVCLAANQSQMSIQIDTSIKTLAIKQGEGQTDYVDMKKHTMGNTNFQDKVAISDEKIIFGMRNLDRGFDVYSTIDRYTGFLSFGGANFNCAPR